MNWIEWAALTVIVLFVVLPSWFIYERSKRDEEFDRYMQSFGNSEDGEEWQEHQH